MPAIVLTFLAAWTIVRIARGTPIAEQLHRILVDTPARLLNRITRGHILTTALFLIVAALLVWQLESDGVRLLGLMAPEIGSFLTMVEVSVYVDAFAAAVALASVVRFRAARDWVAAILVRRTPRARRTRRERPVAGNDDDGSDRARSAPARLAA